MASTSLTKTFTTPTNNLKWTFSAWVKRSNLGTQNIFSAYTDGNNFGMISFNANDVIDVASYIGGFEMRYVTNRVFRDTSAFYHLCVSNDSSLASPETKIYINGVLETSFSESNPASQNEESMINKSGVAHWVGQNGNNQSYFDGSMSHIHFIDGTAYDASAFGETDATTGEWKGKTSPSVTYGNNGFFILKNGNGITDQSGEGNDFTLGGGTLTDLKDNPDNVFATFNSLISSKGQTFSKGNTEVSTTVANKAGGSSTIGMSSGKYYAEFKIAAYDVNRTLIGITSNPSELDRTNVDPASLNYGSGIYFDGRIYVNASVVTTVGATTLNDIIGVALNLDDNNILYYINGVVQNSGTPISITASSSTDTGNYFFSVGDRSTSAYGTVQANFGNGYFGTTAVSSAGTNASEIGIFEYDVPTGYTALSTKGLNE